MCGEIMVMENMSENMFHNGDGMRSGLFMMVTWTE